MCPSYITNTHMRIYIYIYMYMYMYVCTQPSKGSNASCIMLNPRGSCSLKTFLFLSRIISRSIPCDPRFVVGNAMQNQHFESSFGGFWSGFFGAEFRLPPVPVSTGTAILGGGYVRRFADRWGFLNAAAFDGDLFVHREARQHPAAARTYTHCTWLWKMAHFIIDDLPGNMVLFMVFHRFSIAMLDDQRVM